MPCEWKRAALYAANVMLYHHSQQPFAQFLMFVQGSPMCLASTYIHRGQPVYADRICQGGRVLPASL